MRLKHSMLFSLAIWLLLLFAAVGAVRAQMCVSGASYTVRDETNVVIGGAALTRLRFNGQQNDVRQNPFALKSRCGAVGEITIGYQNLEMHLVFNTARASHTFYKIDSLPFQNGTFQLTDFRCAEAGENKKPGKRNPNCTISAASWRKISAPPAPPEKNVFAHLAAAHKRAVNERIGEQTFLRAAVWSDCADKIALSKRTREEWEEIRHPFYAVWDFDKDSQEDFAVALFAPLVLSTKRFTIVVFKNIGDDRFEVAHEIEDLNLSRGRLELDVLEEGVTKLRVVRSPLKNDCAVLHWRINRLVLAQCGEAQN